MFHLTTRRRASSNTALFRTAANGHEADLPALENAPRPAPWIPRAQSYAGRAQSAPQSPGTRAAPAGAIAAARARRKRFGLDASRRLGRKLEFERLLRSGTRRSSGGYVFYFQRRAGPPRLGILVSRRHAAAAVDRNRIKRCIREAFRLEQERIGEIDVLVRPPYGARGSPAMLARVRELLRALK